MYNPLQQRVHRQLERCHYPKTASMDVHVGSTCEEAHNYELDEVL